jgi:hypothetical protein
LPLSLKKKVVRYVSYWQQESGGAWPLYPKMPADDRAHPGLLERSWDEALFRGLRAFDRFTSLVYCYAPISLLRRYRSSKSKGNSPEVAKEPSALPEVSSRS